MKTRSIAAVALLMAATSARADDAGSEGMPSSAWALQFRVYGDLNLTSFSGSALSLKYQATSKFGLRAGISFEALNGSGDEVYTSTIGSELSDFSEDMYSYELSLEAMYYPRPANEVKLFLGGGPFVSIADRDLEQTTEDASSRRDYTYSSYGLSALTGAEWFFTERFSLHAEYGVSVERYSREDILEMQVAGEGQLQSRNSDGWYVGASSVRFGLSAYL